MQIFKEVSILLVAYLLGSIPFGLLIVKWLTGKDIRVVESGRTGGTNAMRAGGISAGLLTAILDTLKGASAVWLARAIGANDWIYVLAPIAAVLGHNYSIFLIERRNGRLHLRGGAGGAPTVGGALGLWAPSILFIVPLGALIWYGIGYASVTTMSVALIALIIFAIRAALGLSPWHYVVFGLLAEFLLMWALRPNIKRLLNGTERLQGWRARRQRSKHAQVTLSGK